MPVASVYIAYLLAKEFSVTNGSCASKLQFEMNGDDMGKIYVWLDISSISQFHDVCKLLAVNSLSAYATAADGFIFIAPVSVQL